MRPQTLPELLEALEEWFPLRNPRPHEDLSTIMYAAGQRSAAEFIIRVLSDDEED